MLQLLHIENIAVIEQADIELEDGLTVLSGETGAGKSIVIDSIGAVLGRRDHLARAGAARPAPGCGSRSAPAQAPAPAKQGVHPPGRQRWPPRPADR